MLTTLFEALARYEPTLVGTFPLGLQVSGSDLDIVCSVQDVEEFEDALRQWCRSNGVLLQNYERRGASQVARFEVMGTVVEVYCERAPVLTQAGFRHMAVEARLLAVGGNVLRERVRALKATGVKTEPAFARVLGLAGDPYVVLLELESWSLDELRALM